MWKPFIIETGATQQTNAPHELEWILVPESGGNSHKRYFRDTLGN